MYVCNRIYTFILIMMMAAFYTIFEALYKEKEKKEGKKMDKKTREKNSDLESTYIHNIHMFLYSNVKHMETRNNRHTFFEE